MGFNLEEGRVTHVNDHGEVDSEIRFTPARGEEPFQMTSSFFAPGTEMGFNQKVMMKIIMKSMRASLNDIVQQVQGMPYAFRGNTPETGFDVGGLVQFVYNRIYGVNFPMDLADQIASVQPVTLEQVMPGDILFWGNAELWTAAGIYLGGGRYLTIDILVGRVMIKTLDMEKLPTVIGSLR